MRSQAEGGVIQQNNTSVGKQTRQSKVTMTVHIWERPAVIDVKYRIDLGARLTAYLDYRRRPSISAKQNAHRNPGN
jgi:hypothetical protein